MRAGRRKLIRAVLTSENKHGGIKHQLQDMVDMIPDVNPMKNTLREIEPLAAYLTAFRCPMPVGRVPNSPSKKDFDEFANSVAVGIAEAARRLGVDLAAKDSPATHPEPIR